MPTPVEDALAQIRKAFAYMAPEILEAKVRRIVARMAVEMALKCSEANHTNRSAMEDACAEVNRLQAIDEPLLAKRLRRDVLIHDVVEAGDNAVKSYFKPSSSHFCNEAEVRALGTHELTRLQDAIIAFRRETI